MRLCITSIKTKVSGVIEVALFVQLRQHHHHHHLMSKISHLNFIQQFHSLHSAYVLFVSQYGCEL